MIVRRCTGGFQGETGEGNMQFQVGRFTAEFKLGDKGQLQVWWSPSRPWYLNRTEREQYKAARAAFLEHLDQRDAKPCRHVAREG